MSQKFTPVEKPVARRVGRMAASIISLAGFLLFSFVAPAHAATDTAAQEAFEQMTQNPDAAERKLRQSNSAQAKLFLAMLLHLERAKTPERDAEIGTLLRSALEIMEKNPVTAGRLHIRLYPEPYNGTLQNLIKHLVSLVSG